MATAIAPPPSTVSMTMDEYLQTSFHPDVHFVEGVIEERNLGEKDHGRLQNWIGAWFRAHEEELHVEAVSEQRMLVSGDRVRICDVAVFDLSAPEEQVAKTPPLICIEIMSPEDRLSRAIKVLEDYRAMGVENIWLIDPQERLAYTFRSEGLWQQENLILAIQSSGIVLNVGSLFEELDRKKNKENA